MPTITTVDATWTNGMTLDEAELRRADTAMFLGDGTANGIRGGIIRHGDTSLAVSVNGSDQVTVQPGAFVIPAATGLGAYRGSLQSATTAIGLTSRNGTNPRIDLIVIQMSSGSAVVKTIDGTPSSSPVAPTLPAQHIELARANVPQVGGGAVTVDSSWRAYATAIGGSLLVETAARLPGSGNLAGQHAVALDTGILWRWAGSAWVTTRGDAVCTLGANLTGSVVAKIRGDAVVLDISITATAAITAFSTLATIPASMITAANGVVWNNNASVATGIYTDVPLTALRNRTAITSGHLLLGQLVMTP